MQTYELQGIREHKGAPRFYKQGKRLALAGFVPGTTYNAVLDQDKGIVILKVSTTGDLQVSKKLAGDKEVPVIDINSKKLLSMFEGMDQIRVIVKQGQIVLIALATEVRRKERIERLKEKITTGQPLAVGSTSHGAGILTHALHSGLHAAGIGTELTFANDIDPVYLAHAQERNDMWSDKTISLAAPLQELAFDEWALSNLPQLDIFEAGLPCTAASVAGRAKKHLGKAEDDPNVGHLIVGFLAMIAKTNPAICLLENVPLYEQTASYAIYKSQMKNFGYNVSEMVLEGHQFGSMENRKRMCSIAVTDGIEFDFSMLQYPEKVKQRIGDILEPIPADSEVWSEMAYLKVKEVRDKAAGKGFMRQEVHADGVTVPTVTRGYMKRRSTDPMLVNPENPNLLRLFTPIEHARIKGVPEHLILGLSATIAHQVLGQGICYKPFFAVGQAIGVALKSWTSSGFMVIRKMFDVKPVDPLASVEFESPQLSLLAA